MVQSWKGCVWATIPWVRIPSPLFVLLEEYIMLSKYFEIKTNSKSFGKSIKKLFVDLKNKKVLLYGAGQGYFYLNNMYKITDKLNVVAIADKKFEKNSEDITGLKQIIPDDIANTEYDAILITNEKPKGIKSFLINELKVEEDNIYQIFIEDIKDEAVNLNYLYKYNFDKTLPKLIKKLNGKTIMLYGAGAYFELIQIF